jgi:alkylated DNA repair dioxygenase AlkB
MKQEDPPGLFDSGAAAPSRSLPAGFRYQSELISIDEERNLASHISTLGFKEFEFQGFTGKRRVVSFGWRYDFNDRNLRQAQDIPPFLLPLRDKAAAFAGIASDAFAHVLITEYSQGAAIGWHRDKAVFDEVVGVSLLSPCRFRFRRKLGVKWQRAQFILQPRSVYLLSGSARTEWEHSIPPMDQLRYSITFRNFIAKQ